MTSTSFGAFIDVESAPRISDPPAVVQKPRNNNTSGPVNIELDQLTWGARYNGPGTGGTQTPTTTNELGMSRPTSPKLDEAMDPVQTLSNPPMNKWRLMSACLMVLGNGMNDSAPGALIPSVASAPALNECTLTLALLLRDYKIGYAVVSLIFVSNALGFFGAAPLTDALQARLGRAKTLMLSLALMILGYVIILCTPPFPLVVISFFFFGFGMATNLGLNNVFCANLANSTTTLGIFHGSYGIGATIAPLMATAMVSHGIRWSHYYLISLGVTSVNLIFAGWSFWHYERDGPPRLLSALERTASRHAAQAMGAPTKMQLLQQAIKNKVTILGALYIFAYQGAEVSISGWVISFLISYRNGNPAAVGYVTSGFWAGVAIGRFILTHPAQRLGERPFLFAVVAGALAFQLLVWLIPNVIGDAGAAVLSKSELLFVTNNDSL
ncbi:MAG: hypothetical protein M1827_002422 [Pycnora praestabilis]|nr:MAG: hypothetical protein M1827_002422 [Pycnora praestabilis]